MKLVIEFKDSTRKVVENVEDFYFDDKIFLRVSIKDHKYFMFITYDSIKCLEVME